MSPLRSVCFLPVLFVAPVFAQSTAIFPAEYSAVAEGPYNSPNLPLAYGVSRTLVVYDRRDLAVPAGASITHVGFRQDATLTTMDTGRTLQLEVRMGLTTQPATAPSTTFDTNYSGSPTTVFGPAAFVLPNLRDTAAPLANGQFYVPLATPFVLPAGTSNLVVEFRVYGTSNGGASFNYRLDRADFYSPVALGPAGCPHSGGQVPALDLTPVRIGMGLTATLTNGPSNSFGALVVQPGGQLVSPFPLAGLVPGIAASCMGQVDPSGTTVLSGITSGQGTLYFSYTVPNNPALNDLSLAHQAILFDFFAPGGLAVSNGASVQIGIQPRAAIVSVQGPPATAVTGALNASYCPVTFFRYQ